MPLKFKASASSGNVSSPVKIVLRGLAASNLFCFGRMAFGNRNVNNSSSSYSSCGDPALLQSIFGD